MEHKKEIGETTQMSDICNMKYENVEYQVSIMEGNLKESLCL